VSRYASTGTRTITITGTGGGVTHTTTVALTIRWYDGSAVDGRQRARAPAVRAFSWTPRMFVS